MKSDKKEIRAEVVKVISELIQNVVSIILVAGMIISIAVGAYDAGTADTYFCIQMNQDNQSKCR